MVEALGRCRRDQAGREGRLFGQQDFPGTALSALAGIEKGGWL